MSDNATIKNLLAETLCEPWRWDENDGYDGDAITRVWYEIPRDDLDGCVQWLEEKTSAGNDAASATVTNPMQGTRWHRSGTWYGGRVWLDWVERDGKRVLGLFQLLHRGSLTIPDVVTRNGCRYKAWTTWYHNLAEVGVLPANDPANGIEYERGPVLVDRDTGRVSYSVTKLQRLYQKISRYTTTVTAARTVRTAHHTGVKQGDLDDDGGSIGLQSMAASVPGKRLALRRTKDPECTQTIDESEEAVNDQTIVDRERTFRAHTDRTIHTQADVALGAPAEQQHHLHRHVSEETEFGRYRTTDEDVTVQDQVITEQGRTARAHTDRTIHTEADAALGAPSEEQHHLHRHVSEETEAGGFRTTDEDVTVQDQVITEQGRTARAHTQRTIHTEADAALAAPVEQQHHLHRHVSEETEAGGFRTTDEDVTVQDQVITEQGRTARAHTQRTIHTEADAALGVPSEEQHHLHRHVSEETEAGGYRTTDEDVTVQDQVITEQGRTARVHTERTIHTEADAALAEPSEEQHHLHRHVSEETEAGGYRTTDEDVTVQDQVITEQGRTARAHTERTIHTEADAALAAPVEQQHHLHRHVSEETEAGGYRTTDEDVTVQDQVITEQGRTARAHTERTIHTEADAALAAPVEEQHHLHRHVSEETEAGGFRTTDEDVTVQDQAIVEQLRSADRHVDRTIHTEADAALGAPSEEQHHIHRHVSEETEAGGYRTTDEDIEVQNRFISEEHYSARSYWLQETNTEEDAALSTPVADPGQHFVARQSSEETEAGGWRNTYRLDRLWDQTHTEQVRSARAHTDRTIHTEADAALAAPVEQQHHIHRHVSEETEAGGYRTTDEDVEVQDQLTTEVERSPSRHGARTIHSEADVPLAAPVEAVGHIRRNISEETEAGGWRTIELDIEPQDQTATNWRKVADVSTSETVHTEGAALTEPATPGEGTIVERRSEPTESGQARTVDQEQTSTENWYPSATTDLPYEGRYGTCYLRMGFNVRSTNLQARIQAFALAHVGMSVSPSVYRQSDRTWTVTLTARAVSGGGGGSDWWDNGTEQYTYTNDDGLSVTVQVLWTTARDKAFSWCNGATLYSMAPPAGQDRIGHDSGNITKPYFMGSSRFKAVRVYRATA